MSRLSSPGQPDTLDSRTPTHEEQKMSDIKAAVDRILAEGLRAKLRVTMTNRPLPREYTLDPLPIELSRFNPSLAELSMIYREVWDACSADAHWLAHAVAHVRFIRLIDAGFLTGRPQLMECPVCSNRDDARPCLWNELAEYQDIKLN